MSRTSIPVDLDRSNAIYEDAVILSRTITVLVYLFSRVCFLGIDSSRSCLRQGVPKVIN